jgi:hypothetical protein
MTVKVVNREELEDQLTMVRALAPGGLEGVFGPASVIWHGLGAGVAGSGARASRCRSRAAALDARSAHV